MKLIKIKIKQPKGSKIHILKKWLFQYFTKKKKIIIKNNFTRIVYANIIIMKK